MMTGNNECVWEVRENEGVAVVALGGEMNMHRTPALQAMLAQVCQDQPARLVINLEQVSHMDSSGLGTLVETLRRIRGYGGTLALCALPERVRGLFEITHLDRLFLIYPSEAEALAR